MSFLRVWGGERKKFRFCVSCFHTEATHVHSHVHTYTHTHVHTRTRTCSHRLVRLFARKLVRKSVSVCLSKCSSCKMYLALVILLAVAMLSLWFDNRPMMRWFDLPFLYRSLVFRQHILRQAMCLGARCSCSRDAHWKESFPW